MGDRGRQCRLLVEFVIRRGAGIVRVTQHLSGDGIKNKRRIRGRLVGATKCVEGVRIRGRHETFRQVELPFRGKGVRKTPRYGVRLRIEIRIRIGGPIQAKAVGRVEH